MSEQKYYVKLKSPNNHLGIWWRGELVVIGWKVSKYIPSFTKSELSEIIDGALYKGHEMNQYCVFLGCEEWVNPLIELVPVEEVEK